MRVGLPARLRFDFPTAMVVVSCAVGKDDKPNLIAVDAISHACIKPPMFEIAIGHTRYSYQIISRSDGFVVNVPSQPDSGRASSSERSRPSTVRNQY